MVCGYSELQNGINLGSNKGQLTLHNHIAQIHDVGVPKLTLGEVYSEFGSFQNIEELQQSLKMLLPCVTPYHHFIEVYTNSGQLYNQMFISF